ncbi:MAG TPA: lysophospholipid acyltransferase family protein [Humisphaera sp.]
MMAGFIRTLTGAQARWVGTDPVRPDGSVPLRVYFANHTSHLDAPVIWASLPDAVRAKTRPVAAGDYWQQGRVRRYLSDRVFRCLCIERQKVTRANNPMSAMEAALEAGDSLILFPEGTRSTEDDPPVQEFKPGLWHLAKRCPQAELVPVFVENLNRILPKGGVLIIPLLAAVTFGEPVKPAEGETKQAFLERARQAVQKLKRGT